jgi:carbamoyltransferase
MKIWGISANSHNAALAVFERKLIGLSSTPKLKLLFASESERFSRIKNDPHISVGTSTDRPGIIDYAIQKYGEPDEIVWYEKPFKKTLRQLFAGQGWLYKDNDIPEYLNSCYFTLGDNPISYIDHHRSHASAGYYTSNFDDAAVVVIDAIGEFETMSVWKAQDGNLKKISSMSYPNSIGLWYSAMTDRIGLKANEDEYILMGMAAYGNPYKFYWEIANEFFEHFGSSDNPKIKLRHNLHRGCRWWRPDLNTEQDYYDIAAATQALYEVMLGFVSEWARKKTKSKNLVLMGGCALNCSANSTIFEDWEDIWIMPAPGDAGSAIGAVLAKYEQKISWTGPYLGYEIEGDYPVEKALAELKTSGIVGVANGRAEFGPRALGNRSLLADPRRTEIKSKVNSIKQRQEFRPFAPAILEEHFWHHFYGASSPYMQYVARCHRPDLFPAIVHADDTSRVQTVSPTDNPGFRRLLERWYEDTGCPLLLNTSLNIKGQPIVNTVQDAQDFEKHYGVKVYTSE